VFVVVASTLVFSKMTHFPTFETLFSCGWTWGFSSDVWIRTTAIATFLRTLLCWCVVPGVITLGIMSPLAFLPILAFDEICLSIRRIFVLF
jgi:hypothetical protein